MARALVLIAVLAAGASSNPALQEAFRWKQLDFQFQDETTRQDVLTSDNIVIKNNVPVGVDVWQDKLFVTVPRWYSGVVSTLNYVDLYDDSESPPLRPYPDWSSNNIREPDGSTVVSVLRLRVDECDRLWVMDMGQDDMLGNAQEITPPKILIYDLQTDKLIHQYTFDETLLKENSFFVSITVDVSPDSCERAFAYAPDIGSNAIVVFHLETLSAHRVQHSFFHMDPLSSNYHVAGLNFQWTDGVFCTALGPAQDDGSRTVYFHPLSSNMEFVVDSRTLQNETASSNYYGYKVLGYKGPESQSVTSVLDPQTGVLFYSLANKNGIGCWNSFTHADDFSPQTNPQVARDEHTMTFISDVKVDREGNLWIMSDKLPVFLFGEIDPEEVNFRVFRGKTKDIIKGTECDTRSTPFSNDPEESKGWFCRGLNLCWGMDKFFNFL